MSGSPIHASAVLIGEAGVLILGPSGAGKSTLARALILAAEGGGTFARLIGDDRLLLEARNDRLVARPHPAIAGMLEARGAGLLAVSHEPAAILRLAVVLADVVERLPEASHMLVAGVRLKRIFVARHGADAAQTVMAALAQS